jgi:protein-disulfide isomerase
VLALLTAVFVAPQIEGQAKTSPTQQAATQSAQVDPLVSSSDRGRIAGNTAAPLWMLIVSDFQCPYCRQWHKETWHAIKKEFVDAGKVRVAYMNFPLSIHPNAKPAARYAMCASAQGKFWEYADELFNTQDQWKDLKDPAPFFDRLVAKVKLPASSISTCVNQAGIASVIDADAARMARAGAKSTPTFFIGRTMIEGAQPIEAFRQAIAAELAAAKKH